MSKKIENEPSSQNKEKPVYYDQYINVMIREFMDTNSKYGDKTNLMEELAKACGVSLSTMKRCKSGYSTLKKYKQIKGLADYTGFDFNKLIESVENKKVKPAKNIKRKLPDDLVIKGVELHNKDSYNVLCSHTFRKGDLFPGRDNFLIFLDYMICEEKFIDTISDKAKDLLQELKKDMNDNKLPKEEIEKIGYCKDYEDFDKLFSQGELDKRLSKLLNEEKIRNVVRAFITKYIYDNLMK